MALLHRDDECARLEKALRACTDGTAGLVLVEGAAGCGKTHFLHHAADAAAACGLSVVQAAADPAARHRDYALLHRLARQLDAGRCRAEPDAAGFAPLLHAACARGPVALCVDDLQHADRASLAELLRLTRTLRGAALLTVLTHTPHYRADGWAGHTELLRHSGFVRIRLGSLDSQDTAELARFWGTPVSPAATTRLHRLSGGNPLLLRALLAEATTPDAHPEWPHPETGGPFAQAYTACLHRCGSAARRLALALAVLGPHADTRRAALLAGLGPHAAARGHTALEAAGLADGPRLPHPTAATAVLAALKPAQRRSLHRGAARVLHHALGEPAVVAEQLLAAGRAAHDWEIQALQDAARHASALPDHPEHAGAWLRLARCASTDEPTRLRVTLQLAAHTWRSHPAAAHHHLDEPLTALRAGRLPPAEAGWLARLLAAQGRVEEAGEVLGRRGGPDAGRPASQDPLRELLAQLPAAHDRPAPAAPPPPRSGSTPAARATPTPPNASSPTPPHPGNLRGPRPRPAHPRPPPPAHRRRLVHPPGRPGPHPARPRLAGLLRHGTRRGTAAARRPDRRPPGGDRRPGRPRRPRRTLPPRPARPARPRPHRPGRLRHRGPPPAARHTRRALFHRPRPRLPARPRPLLPGHPAPPGGP
ncbi:AAA family ATPase (plasmid) [Streptomyces galilaeus]